MFDIFLHLNDLISLFFSLILSFLYCYTFFFFFLSLSFFSYSPLAVLLSLFFTCIFLPYSHDLPFHLPLPLRFSPSIHFPKLHVLSSSFSLILPFLSFFLPCLSLSLFHSLFLALISFSFCLSITINLILLLYKNYNNIQSKNKTP